MGEAHDPNKASKFISYIDCNNLYGRAMSQKLPTYGFGWVNEKAHKHWRIIPCILEVDLEYPEELQGIHNDYPVAPENVKLPGSIVEK